MKDKIIELINELNTKGLDKLTFSLTINYDEIISNYRSTANFGDNIERIINTINEQNEIKNFNFTLYESEETEKNFDDFDMERYNEYWFQSKLVFHGKNKVKTHFDFLSNGLSINHLPKPKTIDQIISINEFYKETSLNLYKLLN